MARRLKPASRSQNAVLQLQPLPITRSPDAADELADVVRLPLYQRNWHSSERPAKVPFHITHAQGNEKHRSSDASRDTVITLVTQPITHEVARA